MTIKIHQLYCMKCPSELQTYFRAVLIFKLKSWLQRNITYIQNQNVSDTMLNLTWTALVSRLEEFEPQDYQVWFNSYLIPLIPSFGTEQLQHIPTSISCESYTAM